MAKSDRDLSRDEAELISLLLEQEGIAVAGEDAIAHDEYAREFPLSPAQEAMWFFEQWQPGSAMYNIPLAVRVSGLLDVDALEQSLSEIVRRHESLRTVIHTVHGKPTQVIQPEWNVHLSHVCLDHLSSPERESTLSRVIAQEARRPFDLAADPMMRATLVRLDSNNHRLLLTIHHIVSDGWSMEVVFRELAVLYAAFNAQRASSLAELPIRYGDYVRWQRARLESDEAGTQLAFWLKQLAQTPAILDLPTDSPRPPTQSFCGAAHRFVVPKALTQALKALAQREGVTPFALLLAAFKVLLLRYTGSGDVVVGTVAANRTRTETEGVVGLFANAVVVRAGLSDNPTFRAFLHRVRSAVLDAYANQDLPFERVVAALQPTRDPSHSPLFQVLFRLNGSPLGKVELPGLTLEPEEIDTGTAKFDLSLILNNGDPELTGGIEYNTDLFESSTIERMAEHFQTLVEGIVANPDQQVWDLPLLPEAERHQVLVEWNQTRAENTDDRCIHHLVEAQAARTPEAVAVVCDDQQLTYGELNGQANQLAHQLQRLGVGPEVPVGICLERSLDLVVGLVAILKAGGAYVPLDPRYPRERLAFMLADAQIPLLLTQEALLDQLSEWPGVVVCIDHDRGTIALESTENPQSDVGPNNLAYVIYTSGSTGKPKGTLVNHRCVARLFSATRPWFAFSDQDVWALFHSIAFDFSVWEVFGALVHGARLVVVPYLVSRSPDAFRDLLSRERVTVLNQTPSAFHELMRADEAASSPGELSLALVIFGGEALEVHSLRTWFDRHGDEHPQLVNMYGITETTVHVTCYPLSTRNLNRVGSIVGRPIPDLQLYVLDPYGQPVPIGVRGELYIGGDGLARGYLNRPALTAERFVPDAFACVPGERLYRTGDLVRYRPDGNLEFVGRIDHQVKIRGFRIELGEIEATLLQYAAVRETVVVAREHDGDVQLIAYIVPRDPNHVPTTIDLRGALQMMLPDYMIPAAFVSLQSLPMTSVGKIDLRSLPAPDRRRANLGQDYVPPRTASEKILAGIWKEALGTELVGANDNFFALGGDSIRSVNVVALAKERGVPLSLQQLFRHQTIAELAKAFDTRPALAAPGPRTRPFSLISEEDRRKLPSDVEDAYPVTALQSGMLYHMEVTPDAPEYHNVDSFHFRGTFDLVAFQQAVEQVVARHAVLRTSFDLTSYSEPLQLVHKHAVLPVQFQDIQDLSKDEQERYIRDIVEQESGRRFDMLSPPLLRFHVHRRSDETFQFTLTEFHPILDGWSLSTVFTETFEAHFALIATGRPLTFPPLESSFRDFVLLERNAADAEENRHYWEDKLRGAVVNGLPRWPFGPDPTSKQRVENVGVPISLDLSEGLRGVARSLGVSIKSVLLATHLKVLSMLTGQSDVLTGFTVNGRPEEKTAELVCGLFLNVLPLRVQLIRGSWLDLVRQASDAEYEALPFRRYPMALIQRELKGRDSLFEVSFNYVSFHVARQLFTSKHLDWAGEVISSEPSNFTLQAGFSSDLVSSNVELLLAYHVDLLTRVQVESIGELYLQVMRRLVDHSLEPHDAVCLLPEQEFQELVEDRNRTWHWYPTSATIHRLFEAQTEKAPNVIALAWDDEELTYCTLNERANQLARHLRKRGIGAEMPVGLCMERSADMIVAVLGILKAGGTYVPLDPAYPSARLALMLSDARVRILLSQTSVLARLPQSEAQVICLDRDWPVIDVESSANLPDAAVAENLAYVMYTSGSTGQPKGVEVSHRSVIRLLFGVDYVRLGPTETILHMSSISFDLSTFEIWGALLHGGRCVLFRDQVPTATTIAAAVDRYNVTTAWITASLFNAVVDENPRALVGIEQLLIGGESLSVAHVRRALQSLPSTQIINGYGPTESTTFACCYPIPGQLDPTISSIPIGKPIGNTQVYVLDGSLHPVPIGTTGEFYIGGDGLARGYLNRSTVTAERFIPNPFAAEPGSRLYKTGDIARYLPDGTIEFLGRVDDQVKPRGFRVEPGEIEAAVKEHPAVRDAVVLVRDDSRIGKHVVAYVVPFDEQLLSSDSLRRYLKARLPDYMIPSGFVALDTLPLTLNGKLDADALPQGLKDWSHETVSFVPPSTPTEKMLCSLYSAILGVDRVGIHDDFFDLGGHSLLATRLISRVREVFHLDLPLHVLFEAATVAEFARQIDSHQAATPAASLAGVLPTRRDGPVLPSYAQQRLWFLDRLNPGNPVYNIPMALHLAGPVDHTALEKSLNEIVRRHEVLRTEFLSDDGQPWQVVVGHRRVPLSVIDLTEAEDRETTARQLAATEARKPFDLTSGQLLRNTLLRLAPHEHVLLLTMHHIISDAWSVEIFLRELSTHYQAFRAGEPSPLPVLPVQYADFAVWQRGWLHGSVLEDQLRYWKQQLTGAPEVLEIPTDHPRSAIQTFRGASERLQLAPGLAQELKALSRNEGATLFMTLLAAYQTLLFRYSGQADLVIGSPIAGRNRRETEGLIGFFVNMLVLRTDLSGNPSFRDLVRRVRRVALDAYEHQDLPFERLVEELRPERSLSHTPLFQVIFDLHNSDQHMLELEGLDVREVTLHDNETSKVDLSLVMEDTPEGLMCAVVYSPDLFQAETIRRLVANFRTLIEGILEDPDRPIAMLPLLPHEEWRELIVERNATQCEYPRDVCLHQLFEAQVGRTPENIAVVCEGMELTYRELDAQATQLAHHLRGLGVGPEVVVGICIERSVEMVVGLLAILKAGAAFLPLVGHAANTLQ